MPRVFLVGCMCSGKTTLGQALARLSGLPFVDLDQAIEDRVGMTVNEIFDSKGEEEFRRLEREELARCCQGPEAVIACGGGTPCQPGAMESMNQAGVTVYLNPGLERLVERMLEGRHKRPLIARIDSRDEMARIAAALIQKREPYYSQSALVFDSSSLETEAEIAQSAQRLSALLNI